MTAMVKLKAKRYLRNDFRPQLAQIGQACQGISERFLGGQCVNLRDNTTCGTA